MTVERDGLAGFSLFLIKARVVAVDLARLEMDRVTGLSDFDGVVNRGHLGVNADPEIAGVEIDAEQKERPHKQARRKKK